MRFSATTPTLKELFVQLSYNEIQRATGGFSMANLVGAGSFGSVYKGVIVGDSGSDHVVAIKVFKIERRGAIKSFVAECDSLRGIRHQNLVNIVTVCSSVDAKGNDFKALVFDYMPKGSLDDWLHPRVDEECGQRSLSLVQRWKVIMDVAFALEYLHRHCHTPIVHCDLKPSNVLLDDDMTARICDFGLARTRCENVSNNATLDPSSSSAILGSIGYIAPEYGMGGTFTTQGDVYSFGVLVLETFTGKRPTNEIFQGNLNLHKYVAIAYPDGIMDIIDPSLLLHVERASDNGLNAPNIRDKIYDFMVLILKLGLSCSMESPEERKEIGNVLNDLFQIEKLLHGLN